MPRPRFKQRPRVRRAPILSGLLVVAFCVLAPTALAEPADEQYNFNPPSPGGDGGESSSGSSPTGGSDTGAPGGLAALSANSAENGTGTGTGTGTDGTGSGADASGAAPGSTISTFASPSDDGASDGSALSAVTDSIGLGVMPVLLAAMAAIAIGGVSLALYRRRERPGTEAV